MLTIATTKPKESDIKKVGNMRLSCKYCGKEFLRYPSTMGKYCSTKCANDAKKNWSEESDTLLIALQKEGKTFSDIAAILGRTTKAIKSRSVKIGGGYRKKWTDDDISIIKNMVDEGVEISIIAEKLNTTRSAINWQIHKHGIGATPGTEQFSKKASRRTNKLWNNPDHIFNKPEYKEKLRKAHQDPNSKFNSEEYRQALSDSAYRRKPGLAVIGPGSNHYRGGFREDLGHYVRSRWEANIARYLRYLIEKGEIQKYEYEPDTFDFTTIKRGNRSYMPDFKVYLNNKEIEYWEVKGYMDKESQVKLKRMAKYYPNIKIILIERPQYNAIKKWSGIIPNWE